MTSLKHKLTEKIKSGEIDMTPKWHFALRAFLSVAASVVILLIAIYLLSFILFVLSATGLLLLPSFGLNGLMFFIVSSPWILIFAVCVLLGLLYVLVSKYSFSYRRPLVYSLVGVVFFVIAVSSLIEKTTMHNRVQAYVKEHNVPGFAPMYRDFVERRPGSMTVGVIKEVTDIGYNVVLESGDEITVLISERTKMPRVGIASGESVLIFGPRTGTTIKAFGVRPFDVRRSFNALQKGSVKGLRLHQVR